MLPGTFACTGYRSQRSRSQAAAFVAEGVPSGAISALPRSLQWPEKTTSDPPSELSECLGNWTAAEAEPHLVQALLDKEIANKWVVRTSMSLEQARKHWHRGIAVGKLNVVHAEGKEPRLVRDSTPAAAYQNA